MVSVMSKKGILLDRDGVINRAIIRDDKPCAPRSLTELEILPNVVESIEILRQYEFKIAIITNQPDLSKNLISQNEYESINNEIKKQTGIKKIYTCVHLDSDNCECRKPKTKLLKQASLELNLELKSSFLIGDRWRDIEAGQAAGCSCFFIDYGYKEKKPQNPFTTVENLLEATLIIIKRTKNDRN